MWKLKDKESKHETHVKMFSVQFMPVKDAVYRIIPTWTLRRIFTHDLSPHLPFVIEGIMEVMGAVAEKLIVTSCAWSCVWFCFQISEKN